MKVVVGGSQQQKGRADYPPQEINQINKVGMQHGTDHIHFLGPQQLLISILLVLRTNRGQHIIRKTEPPPSKHKVINWFRGYKVLLQDMMIHSYKITHIIWHRAVQVCDTWFRQSSHNVKVLKVLLSLYFKEFTAQINRQPKVNTEIQHFSQIKKRRISLGSKERRMNVIHLGQTNTWWDD